MLSDAIGDFLPAALAVALSPIPIVAVVLMLDTPRARVNGPAFLAGWVAGLMAVSVVVVAVVGAADGAESDTTEGVNWTMLGIGGLFLVMAVRQWGKRPRRGEAPEMPAWMATLDSVSPVKALLLGTALSGANPKNVALTLTASASIAQAGLDGADTVVAVAVFVAIGSATVLGAVAFHLLLPDLAERPLAAVKRFMADHSAVIMAIILLVLGVKLLADGLGGLTD